MDLSKLPRLSNSEQRPPTTPVEPEPVDTRTASPQTIASPPTQQPRPAYAPFRPASSRGEAWIAFAVGIIILLMFPRFVQWGSSRIFHTHFNQYVMPDGITVVPYQQVHDIWPDLGCTLFGFTLIFEGLALGLARHRWILWIGLAFTLLATGYNLVYLIVSFGQYGLALVSALAVAFGAYITAIHWQLLHQAD